MCIFLLTACLCSTLAGCFQESIPPETQTTAVPTVETEPHFTKLPTAETEAGTMTTEPTEPASRAGLLDHLSDADFVAVKELIPDVAVELKNTTEDNFTGSVIYEFEEAYLRFGTAKKLEKVQMELRGLGLGLKIWDAFRPVDAQWKLWEAYPDPKFVSHPVTGGRSHCRGNTVDVTLVDAYGQELEMPSSFDDFSDMADRDFSDCTDKAAVNAGILQHIMEKHGFTTIQSEWWHFVDETDYAVDEKFVPAEYGLWYAVCEEYINLREAPDVDAASVLRIPVNEAFYVLGWYDRFALVEYQEQRGYVNRDYISPGAT